MMWSTHSRRIDPISRSAKPFYQGEAGAVGLSRMPMVRTRRVTMLPMELNDAGTLALRDHTGRELADMIVDQFEELLERSERQTLVFALSLHGFIVGQPFRLRPLRQAIKH